MDVPAVFVRQGRRNYQEDRTLFQLGLRIPFHGREGTEFVNVGMLGVFDGHNGADASEMASKDLLSNFLSHVENLENDKENGLELDVPRFTSRFPDVLDRAFHMKILRESLLMAVKDIDAKFSEEARKNNISAGSTAVVVLIVENQLLVANVGDSKAILCSETSKTKEETKAAREKFYRQRRSRGNLNQIIFL